MTLNRTNETRRCRIINEFHDDFKIDKFEKSSKSNDAKTKISREKSKIDEIKKRDEIKKTKKNVEKKRKEKKVKMRFE